MKFRTKIASCTALQSSLRLSSARLTILEIAQCFEKLTKSFVLHLSPTVVRFLLYHQNASAGLQASAKTAVDALFEGYRIESLHSNQIWLDVPSEHLTRALKSAMMSDEIIMKLAKRNAMPVLSIVGRSTTRAGKSLHITQDIPVKVISPSDASLIREPTITEPEIGVILPPLHSLKNIMDKLRLIHNRVLLRASTSGELKITLEADNVKIISQFNNLRVEALDGHRGSQDQERAAEAYVDIKDLLKFCSCTVLNPSSVACQFSKDNGLLFLVHLGDDSDSDIPSSFTFCEISHKKYCIFIYNFFRHS
ncbi:checkpoint protein Hus1/Mec3 [Chytridium lagenaria]|nr:checkpoint protein Hus1/Mec3 [Chytridium lagenaria]